MQGALQLVITPLQAVLLRRRRCEGKLQARAWWRLEPRGGEGGCTSEAEVEVEIEVEVEVEVEVAVLTGHAYKAEVWQG